MSAMRRRPRQRRALALAAGVLALALAIAIAAGRRGPAVALADHARLARVRLQERLGSLNDTLSRALSAETRQKELILAPERKP